MDGVTSEKESMVKVEKQKYSEIYAAFAEIVSALGNNKFNLNGTRYSLTLHPFVLSNLVSPTMRRLKKQNGDIINKLTKQMNLYFIRFQVLPQP